VPDLVPALPYVVSGVLAGGLTYCDLDAVFDAPPRSMKRTQWFALRAWWWGFILANAGLAAILYFALNSLEYFKSWNPYLAALFVGASYTALVRLQFTTIKLNGNATPLGFETLYEAVKGVIHRRINRIIRDWREAECAVVAHSELDVLRRRAMMMVKSDALLSVDDQNRWIAWIERISGDAATSDSDRRDTLAVFIVTEQPLRK
jgi:hypothetical protein